MLVSRDFLRACCAEFLATFFFIFVAVGTAIGSTRNYPGSRGIVIATGFGMSIFTLIHCFGHISGANINPAVTVALFLSRQIEWIQCVAYVIAQTLGSIFASGVLLIVFDYDILGGYAPPPAPHRPPLRVCAQARARAHPPADRSPRRPPPPRRRLPPGTTRSRSPRRRARRASARASPSSSSRR
jgi:hypothetical protein